MHKSCDVQKLECERFAKRNKLAAASGRSGKFGSPIGTPKSSSKNLQGLQVINLDFHLPLFIRYMLVTQRIIV